MCFLKLLLINIDYAYRTRDYVADQRPVGKFLFTEVQATESFHFYRYFYFRKIRIIFKN